MLEKSIWAPGKTAQLSKNLEAGTKNTCQDHKEMVVQEPFPKLKAKPSRNVIYTAASAASKWSEAQTTQMIKNLEARAPPSALAPRPQKSAEAFPALGEPAGSSERAAVPSVPNAKATQLWGHLAKQVASAVEKTTVDNSDDKGELVAKVVDTKTGRGGNRRRWTPLPL